MRCVCVCGNGHPVSSEISFLVEKLELIRRHICIIERTLIRLTDETEEGKYLLSIRGLNYAAVAGLLAELGCSTAYRSAKQLIKMADSNPTESESAGKSGCTYPDEQAKNLLLVPNTEQVLPDNPVGTSWASTLYKRMA